MNSSFCMTCGSEVCDPAKHGKSLSDRLARALGASTDVSVPLPHLPLRVDRRDVEIDSLRAEVARLTSELDHARADIAAWEAACAKERATTDERTAELLAVTLELADLLGQRRESVDARAAGR